MYFAQKVQRLKKSFIFIFVWQFITEQHVSQWRDMYIKEVWIVQQKLLLDEDFEIAKKTEGHISLSSLSCTFNLPVSP